jgi:enoyl-CoA hydratase/carnithine racemase
MGVGNDRIQNVPTITVNLKVGEPMETANNDAVLFEYINDHIALVTLNRPEKYNAVNTEVTEQLFEILTKIEADKNIWVAVLASSNDRYFCVGADLAAVSAGKGLELIHPVGGFAGFVNAPRKKPWIAAVAGSALGGGFEICLACDMIVCGEKTVFALPEVKRSLIAGAGGVYRLPRALPRVVALELIATGDPIDSQRAYNLGMVNRVVADNTVRDEAIKLAGKICENAPVAVCESLSIARAVAEQPEKELQAQVMGAFGKLNKTRDFQEGPLAFMEKRAPRWSGE